MTLGRTDLARLVDHTLLASTATLSKVHALLAVMDPSHLPSPSASSV